MAKQRTGIDVQAPPPRGLSEEEKKLAQQQAAENAKQAQGGRVRGAARGAAGGAAIGAIAGDAGKGAGAGAVAGTMRGGAQQRQANAQSKEQAAAQTAANAEKSGRGNATQPPGGCRHFPTGICGLLGRTQLFSEVVPLKSELIHLEAQRAGISVGNKGGC